VNKKIEYGRSTEQITADDAVVSDIPGVGDFRAE